LYCEKLVEALQRDEGRNIHVGRFHNVYGSVFTAFDKERGKAPCHLILKTIKHPEPPMVLWGDGRAVRSYLYIDDCVEAVLRLMDTDHQAPINIGSDRCVSVEELAGIVIGISGKKIVPEHDTTKPVGVMGRNSDNTLAKQVLEWEPQVRLEEGLARVYHWAEEHYSELEGI
jgi:nucleoside-diphosphate-sugar epimerase